MKVNSRAEQFISYPIKRIFFRALHFRQNAFFFGMFCKKKDTLKSCSQLLREQFEPRGEVPVCFEPALRRALRANKSKNYRYLSVSRRTLALPVQWT
jgi:hypothetical protein